MINQRTYPERQDETSQDLRKLVDTITDLPSFPAAIQKATAVAADPRASAADLAAVIEVDAALTTKVLRITNSAFYGFSREISTVKEGVVILGFSAVRSLAVAVSAMKMFRGENSQRFNHEKFWYHCACSAFVAQQIGQLAPLPGGNDAFTAALLHDIGKIALDQYAHDAFMRLLETQRQRCSFTVAVEQEMIKTTHAEIGRHLTERWKLPVLLCEAIGGHHDPSLAGKHAVLAMLSGLADLICTLNGIPSVIEARASAVPAEWLRLLKISSNVLEQVQSRFPDIRRNAQGLIENV